MLHYNECFRLTTRALHHCSVKTAGKPQAQPFIPVHEQTLTSTLEVMSQLRS